jgi:hypothetical protein
LETAHQEREADAGRQPWVKNVDVALKAGSNWISEPAEMTNRGSLYKT